MVCPTYGAAMTTPNHPGPSKRFALSYSLVKQFHETFKHPVATEPTPNTLKHRRLRVALIAEELGELCQALGVPMEISVFPVEEGERRNDADIRNCMGVVRWVGPDEICCPDHKVDLVEAADALGDLDYVVQGANLVFGFQGPLIVEEIHTSNMSKLGADGKPIWDENGKVVKGPNYCKPDVARFFQQGSLEELWGSDGS